MLRKTTALIASATLALCLASTAFAASNVWMRVITVKSDNVSAYMQQLETGRAMMKRLGVSMQLRVFRATFAGPNTGTIVVTQEYPSWAALADSQAKTAADPEFSKWLKNLDSVRTITSDSLYREL
jgi:hypothetical protein